MYERTNEREQTQDEAERERERREQKSQKEELTPTQNVHYAWAGAPNQTEETRARGLAIHTKRKIKMEKQLMREMRVYALSVCVRECVSWFV